MQVNQQTAATQNHNGPSPMNTEKINGKCKDEFVLFTKQ